jgi:hypothetical protein
MIVPKNCDVDGLKASQKCVMLSYVPVCSNQLRDVIFADSSTPELSSSKVLRCW